MKRNLLTIAAVTVLLLSGCGEKKSQHAQNDQQVLPKHTFLTGTIKGKLNGKAFSHEEKEPKNCEILTRGDTRRLQLEWMTELNTIVFDLPDYQEGETYTQALNVLWMNMALGAKKLKVLDKQMRITQYTPERIKGAFEVNVELPDGKTTYHLKGEFDMHEMKVDQNNEAAVLEAIEEEARVITSLDPKWRTDKQYVLKAFAKNGSIFSFIDPELQNDQDFLLQLMETNPKKAASVYYQTESNLRKNKAFALKALTINQNIFSVLPASLQNDSDIRKAAGKEYP